ncbi:MAG: hypothetical protein PQJ44_00085, partial [Sphaerochaetaceae bacterium]|nr:hypothetical protein [Sphaerochaetaceae bacterium]
MQNSKIGLYLLFFILFLSLISCKNDSTTLDNYIEIYIDDDVDSGIINYLNSLDDAFEDIDIVIKTNIAQNKEFFMKKYLSSNFSQ